MSMWLSGRRGAAWSCWTLVGTILVAGGCNEPANWNLSLQREETAANAPLDPNIVQVVAVTRTDPWINFNPELYPNPDGISVMLYLISGRTGKGAFGDGVIRATMYVLEPGPDGKRKRRKVHEWRFEPDEAYPYRIKKKYLIGWAYGLRLCWGKADVLGKEIALVFEFERRDGKIIRAQPKLLRVPPPV